MTTNGHMECDAVEGRLLDLVYGELDGDESAAVRTHASGCESCSRSLAKLEGGRAIARKMSTEDAPSPAMAAVMAAAKAKAGEHQRAAARQRIADAEEKRDARPSARTRAAERERKESGGFFADLLRKLGSFATGPQVAMATLLVLMVGIGLWSAPQMTGRDTGSPSAVLEPDPEGEIGPSAGAIQPAEPLHLEVDPRTDRMVDPEERAEAEEPPRPRPVVPSVEPTDDVAAAAAAAVARSERRTPAASDEVDPGAAEALAAAEAVIEPGEGVGGVEQGELPEPEGAAAGELAMRVEERPVAPSAPSIFAPQPSAPQPSAPQPSAPPPSASRPSAPPPSAPRPSAPPPSAPAPSESMRAPTTSGSGAGGSGAVARSGPGSSGPRSVAPSAARSGPDAVEAPRLDPDATARGMVARARNYATAGRFSECVQQYQRVLDEHPTYGELGTVLLGQGECQARLGQLEAAERTYARAERLAASREEASRRSAQVRAQRLARDRAARIDQREAAPAAAPPEPARAY